MDKELREKGDVLYRSGLDLLADKKPDEAASKFKEAMSTFIKAKDGVAAAISHSFSLEYCRQTLEYDKENIEVQKVQQENAADKGRKSGEKRANK